MRIIFFLLLALVLSENIQGQQTFNKRQSLGYQVSYYTSVIEVDSGYFCTGVGVLNNSSRAGASFTFIDSLGNLVWTKHISGDSSSNIGAYEATLHQLNDGTFVTVGVEFGGVDHKTCFFKYKQDGDTAFIQKWVHPNEAGSFFRGDGLAIIDSNRIVVGSSAQANSNLDTEVIIRKLDDSGNVDWEKMLRSPSLYYREKLPRIKYINNQIVIAAWYYKYIWATTSNFTFSHQFWWLDSLGNIDSIFITPHNYPDTSDPWLLSVPNDLIQTKDGGWVIVSAWGVEKFAPAHNIVEYDPYIYKLDSNLNLEWDRIYYDIGDNEISELTKVYQLEDSSFIAFGHTGRYLNNQTVNQGCWKGMVAKLSPAGDSLWSRYYYAICDFNEENLIKDAKPTSDGGFIICGESSGSGSGPYQQGWLLKLDSMGCLVPGCHITAVEEVEGQELLQIKTYPNPATDYLNVYVPPIRSSSDLQLHLYNLEGKLVQNHSLPQSDATYMMQVDDLVAGVYLLQLLDGDGRLLGSRKVVIQN